MAKHTASVSRKGLTLLVLLGIICMMANTCPVRRLLTSASLPAAHTGNSINPVALSSQKTHCSDMTLNETVLQKQANSDTGGFPLLLGGFILAGLNGWSFRHSASVSIGKKRNGYLFDCVPIFIKNQAIIR